MDATSSALASALFQWVNTFNLPTRIESWRDLEDGQVIWLVLHDIDPQYFQGSLPENDRNKSTDNWIPRWQNLKHIDRMVTTYIRDECQQLPNLSRNMNPDLKAIAIDGSPEQSLKVPLSHPFFIRAPNAKDRLTSTVLQLLESVMFAAMFSPASNGRMVTVMQSLGTKTMQSFAGAIASAQDSDARLAEYGAVQDIGSDMDISGESEHPARGASSDRDPGLEQEEKLIRSMQKNKELDDKITLLTEDNKEYEEKIARLQKQLNACQEELERRQHHAMGDQDMDKSRDERDYIAQLESDLQYNQSRAEDTARQLERFKEDGTTKQQLRDELRLLQAERDELLSKSKTNENLKKKIQVLQEEAKTTTSLRTDLQAANEQLQEFDYVRERCISLQKANDESAKAIANGEQTIFDQKTARQRLEHDNYILLQKQEQFKEMSARLQEQVREYEEKLRDLESSGAVGEQLSSLGDELEATARAADVKRDMQVTHAALRFTCALMRRYRSKAFPKGTSADTLVAQQQRDALSARNKNLEEKYLNVLEENLGLNEVVKSGIGAEKLEGTSYFVRQRDQLQATSKELDETKSKYIASTSENADLRHRISAAETGNPNADVEALKYNKERQEYTEQLERDARELRGILWHAIKRDQDNALSDIRQSNEYKLWREQIGAIHAAPATEAPQIIDHTAVRVADRIVKAWKEAQDATKVGDKPPIYQAPALSFSTKDSEKCQNWAGLGFGGPRPGIAKKPAVWSFFKKSR